MERCSELSIADLPQKRNSSVNTIKMHPLATEFQRIGIPPKQNVPFVSSLPDGANLLLPGLQFGLVAGRSAKPIFHTEHSPSCKSHATQHRDSFITVNAHDEVLRESPSAASKLKRQPPYQAIRSSKGRMRFKRLHEMSCNDHLRSASRRANLTKTKDLRRRLRCIALF